VRERSSRVDLKWKINHLRPVIENAAPELNASERLRRS
jgi:hypothetical protein